MNDSVVIVDAEMASVVGMNAAEMYASARSRIQRVASIDFCDFYHNGFNVGAMPQDQLPPLAPSLQEEMVSDRERRMLRLAGDPLQAVVSRLPKDAAAIDVRIGLPEHHNKLEIEPAKFFGRLYRQSQLDLNANSVVGVVEGRASALVALQSAVNSLTASTSSFAIVGGVDSYIDLYVLGTLEMQKRIRTDRNADGFAPGEGAGFVVLTTEKIAKHYGLSPMARVESIGVGDEPGHIYSDAPYLGDGLSTAITDCLDGTEDVPDIDCVYSSFNGERYWAKEFSVAMLRNKARFSDAYQLEHPSECCGDLGAAGGGIMLGLAAHRVRRRSGEGATLVYASSDFGQRAAVLLTAA